MTVNLHFFPMRLQNQMTCSRLTITIYTEGMLLLRMMYLRKQKHLTRTVLTQKTLHRFQSLIDRDLRVTWMSTAGFTKKSYTSVIHAKECFSNRHIMITCRIVRNRRPKLSDVAMTRFSCASCVVFVAYYTLSIVKNISLTNRTGAVNAPFHQTLDVRCDDIAVVPPVPPSAQRLLSPPTTGNVAAASKFSRAVSCIKNITLKRTR